MEPVLEFNDPEKPVRVSTDASKDKLGAVLLQKHGTEWFPIAYASRTMRAADRNYTQIEKKKKYITHSFWLQKVP